MACDDLKTGTEALPLGGFVVNIHRIIEDVQNGDSVGARTGENQLPILHTALPGRSKCQHPNRSSDVQFH